MNVPYYHVAMLVRFAASRGCPVDECLDALSLSPARFGSTTALATPDQYTALLLEVDRRSSAPELWFEFGRQMTLTAIGELGQLFLSSSCPR